MSISHITINASPNIVVNITYEGCTGTATTTTAFNSAVGNVWEAVADITVDPAVTQPSITFTYASGTLASSGGRWYSDAFKFQNDPCIFSTIAELVGGVTGPLAAGQTFVNVPAVANGATAVSVYANGVLIGQKTTGITAGLNRVDTTVPLVKGQIITVTQSDANGVECCRASTGPIVGAGANPTVAVALSVRQDATLTGPIGANGGGGSTIIKFIGATNVASGGAPFVTKTFSPGNDWQTVEFLRGDDPANPRDPTFLWNGTDTANANKLVGDFGVLDGLAFAVVDDTGPYGIYIDNFMNGSTRIQDFEGFVPGTSSVLFTQPSFSGTTSPFLLSSAANVFSPNTSVVTNNTSDEGSQSLFVSWQFKDTNRVNWLRLPSPSSALGSPNPIVDLRLPISFRMLILPPGVVPPPSAPVFSAGPADRTVLRGGSTTLRASFKGTPPLTFRWLHNGAEIPNATNSSLTLTNVQLSDGGAYRLRASNSLGSDTSPEGIVTVENVPYSNVMTPLWRIAVGARPYLANDNNTRSIAYNASSGNLLLASRTGSNAVHVLNGDSGAYQYTLPAPAGGYTGGTLALNTVVAADGVVYAGNLTADGATTTFKIYEWIDESQTEIGGLVWEGNPSGSADIHARWGDTMVVQGLRSEGQEVMLASADGAYLSFIRPDFGINSAPLLVEVSGAASGNLRTGLALGGDDTLWAKAPGLALIHTKLDPNRSYAFVDRSYSTVPNMVAVGYDPVQKLLAGVFVENPDNLRLFDASDSATLVPLDTELFPSDNANANATGSVAFGPNRVYALDSNNGLIAMSLDLTCLPDSLHIERAGQYALITWTRSSMRLQGTTQLAGAATVWDNVAGSTSALVPSNSGMKFFRLICP